jgi:hypothetical protein
MTQRITVSLLAISLLGLSAGAQDIVNIGPNDDVFTILQDWQGVPDVTIIFEAGYYSLTQPIDETGDEDFITVADGMTIRGAGSGMDPATATILDLNLILESGFYIEGVAEVTIEDLTILNTVEDGFEISGGAVDITVNNVWALKIHGDGAVTMDSGEAAFNYCVFGWGQGDTVYLETGAVGVFTNCDIFLGDSDNIEVDTDAWAVLLNCIVYAGNASNDIEVTAGGIIVRSSVGWDPFDGDPPGWEPDIRLGRIDLNGLPDVDETCVGEDPLYVRPPGPVSPGVGNKAADIDLHLQDGSPALTAGSTSFDEEHNPTGDPTYAGSQGPAPVDVGNWSVY